MIRGGEGSTARGNLMKKTLSLLLVAGSMAPMAAEAQVAQPAVRYEARTIRVSGTGEYRVQPDLAILQFAVETTGATAQDAASANAERMEGVIGALVAAGVGRSDIQTSGYALFPEYAEDRRPGAEREPPRIRGYRAMNQVSVRTRDLDGVGSLIDAGLAAGANRLSGVGFEIEDRQAAEAEALARAVEDARAAAETMARALGVTLGPVLDATTAAQPMQPFYRGMAQDMRMEAAVAAPTPIEAGEQTVRATASLVYGIE